MTIFSRTVAAMLAMTLMLSACATPRHPGTFTSQQISTLQEQGFVATGDGYQRSIADRLLFASDSSALESDRLTQLSHTAAALIAVDIAHIRIDGHTDDVGTADYNLRLSLARAQSVATAMISGGFVASNVQLRGLGEAMPVSDNATPEGRAENRRVVMIVSAP